MGRGGCRYLRVAGRGGDRGDEGACDQGGEQASAGAGPSGVFGGMAWLKRMAWPARLAWLAWLAWLNRLARLIRPVCLAWLTRVAYLNQPVCMARPGRSIRSRRSPPP
ncbi:hypothetical protein GCM10018775_60030 [Streptomyces umbrinus]|nr:hypothetical protein GCM10018775_60030 [Streptomyces umbrinus]